MAIFISCCNKTCNIRPQYTQQATSFSFLMDFVALFTGRTSTYMHFLFEFTVKRFTFILQLTGTTYRQNHYFKSRHTYGYGTTDLKEWQAINLRQLKLVP
ncbi:hypothetical protein QEG73_11220 [Chitinophagaceae bacterium 26-R-25]|nr:hypothetical protein [Chitinophagaceae bacterium 26-R-25]